MAKKEMGGGVLLDECHAFDWMQWLIGPIQGVFSVVGTLSDLEVTSDDVCEVIARFGPRTVGSIHLDMVDRSLRTEVEIIGTASTLRVDVRKHRVELYSHENRKWQDWEFEPSYEQMYIDEIDHFFDCVAKKTKPMSDLRDGYRVQRVIDACARSSDTGRWVAVG
jgi:predicted dehydrogenase